MAGFLGGPDPWRRPKPKPAKPKPARGFPTGPRPPAPTKLPGRPKPVVVKPPVPVPAPPRPDFNSWYTSDPRYLQMHPQYEAQRSGTYAQYGWFPELDANGKPVLDANGKPKYRQASAAEDPNSIVNQLANALAGRSQNIQDSANSRGLLFSGAQVQGQQNAITENDRQLSDAQLAFQRALAGINKDEADTVSSLYPDYVATAPPGNTTAAAGGGGAAASGMTPAQKEADRQRRMKKAQDHLAQDKIDAARRKKAPPKKTTATGKKRTIGSGPGAVR